MQYQDCSQNDSIRNIEAIQKYRILVFLDISDNSVITDSFYIFDSTSIYNSYHLSASLNILVISDWLGCPIYLPVFGSLNIFAILVTLQSQYFGRKC